VNVGKSDACTLRVALESTLRWNSRRELVVDGGQSYDGARLASESDAVANALLELGIRPGNRVAFLGSNSARFVVAFLGAQRLGVVTCNINPRESGSFLQRTLLRLEVQAVICDPPQVPRIVDIAPQLPVPPRVICLGDDRMPGADLSYQQILQRKSQRHLSEALLGTAVQSDDPAIIILSSGSTGDPKGIRHSQGNFVRWLRAAPALFYHVEPATRFLVVVGTSFAAWPFSAMSVLYAGGTIVLMDGFTPEGFCETVQREKITMAGPVPTMIRKLEPQVTQHFDLSSFRMALCAGEPPSASDIARIRSWADTDIRCLYLASESAPGAATFWQLRDQLVLGKPVCAGRPVPGADLRIVDPDGGVDAERIVGQTGEILLRGPTLSQGYLGNDELTNRRFVDGWWRSGDLGRLDEDGFLHVEGRTDNTINTGGIKVQGEEVELCLLAHPDVLQAAVVGVSDPRWGQRIEAHVVARPGTTVDALADHCRSQLAAFKNPKRIVLRDSLPAGPTGKLDRVSLRSEVQSS